MKKIWHYIVLKITIPTHERRTTPPGSISPIRVRRVCCMTQPISFRTYPWRLQYSSQIVETGAICLEFSPNFFHASHLCSHLNVPVAFPNVERSVFWSTEMTANPNQHWGGKNHTSVSRFVTRIVEYLTIQWCQGNTFTYILLKGINDLKNLRASATRNRTQAAAKTIIQLSKS